MEKISEPLLVSKPDEVQYCMEHYSFNSLLDRFREADKQQAALGKALYDGATMVLATMDEEIVGYAIVLPPEQEERWIRLDYISVLGVVEIAPDFRGYGLSKELVRIITSSVALEKKIIVSLEYYWHWDVGITDGDPNRYAQILKKMLRAGDFEEYETNDPDIAGYPYNFMMARVGNEITNDQLYDFVKLANPNSFA